MYRKTHYFIFFYSNINYLFCFSVFMFLWSAQRVCSPSEFTDTSSKVFFLKMSLWQKYPHLFQTARKFFNEALFSLNLKREISSFLIHTSMVQTQTQDKQFQ